MSDEHSTVEDVGWAVRYEEGTLFRCLFRAAPGVTAGLSARFWPVMRAAVVDW